ncbi:MAG: hypothetical protein NT080_06665 [Spirochaetes bacterium]|nr:hypothetical protein [Spirochaetota bacterium]
MEKRCQSVWNQGCKIADSGREIALYGIEKGQSCILSLGCGAGIASFPASVVAEKATSAAFLLCGTVRRLFAEGATFRDYVLDQYSRSIRYRPAMPSTGSLRNSGSSASPAKRPGIAGDRIP